MANKKYKLAGHIFEMQCLYDSFEVLAREFEWKDPQNGMEIPEKADLVRIEPEDIAFEKQRVNSSMSENKVEIYAVHRKVCRILADYRTIMFHSSALAVDGKAFLFAAPSGTGKSTHARLWREVYGDRVTMVNDDKPFLRIEDSVIAYGTPWNGKHHLGTNISVPVAGICILERGTENRIKRISSIEAIPFLLGQTYYTEDAQAIRNVISLTMEMAKKVPIWKMECNMEKDAAETAYQAMIGSTDAESRIGRFK